MPSGEIISDAEAWQIALRELAKRNVHSASAWAAFLRTGEVSIGLTHVAVETRGGVPETWPDTVETRALWAYVVHHGSRGPVDGWASEDGVS